MRRLGEGLKIAERVGCDAAAEVCVGHGARGGFEARARVERAAIDDIDDPIGAGVRIEETDMSVCLSAG
jgi:hypothetical protein